MSKNSESSSPKALDDLYESYYKLSQLGWKEHEIRSPESGDIAYPIKVLMTEAKGKALWVLSGIHGEEPAGPNAIAQEIDTIKKLTDQDIPMIIIPVANPKGYTQGTRYPDGNDTGHSVGDADHLLPDLNNPKKARAKEPSSSYANVLTSSVLDLSQAYPPLITFDHHEDDEFPGPDKSLFYLFSQGRFAEKDPIIHEVRKHLNKSLGLRSNFNGFTDIGEPVRDGIVGNTSDGSIDELLAAERIIKDGIEEKGPNAKHAIVIESDSKHNPIFDIRVDIHRKIIQKYASLWAMAKNLDRK